jgi:hypothetical protein
VQDQRAMTGFGHATSTGGLHVLYGATIRNDSALYESILAGGDTRARGAEEFPPEVPPPRGVSIVIVVEDLRTHRADVVGRGGESGTSGRGGLGCVLQPRRSRRGAGRFRRTDASCIGGAANNCFTEGSPDAANRLALMDLKRRRERNQCRSDLAPPFGELAHALGAHRTFFIIRSRIREVDRRVDGIDGPMRPHCAGWFR